MRHRLVVLAPNPVKVVEYAGGWLFDRAMAGWQATVLTPGGGGSRPLQILGSRTYDLETAVTAKPSGYQVHAMAVDAHLYETDARVRRLVLDALGRGLSELWLWGDPLPADLGGATGSMQHRLSVAARAFKAQALEAAAAPADSLDLAEVFRGGNLPRTAPVSLERVPATL